MSNQKLLAIFLFFMLCGNIVMSQSLFQNKRLVSAAKPRTSDTVVNKVLTSTTIDEFKENIKSQAKPFNSYPHLKFSDTNLDSAKASYRMYVKKIGSQTLRELKDSLKNTSAKNSVDLDRINKKIDSIQADNILEFLRSEFQ